MIPRWVTAPARRVWGIVLDCALGAEEPFEYQGTTTPDVVPPLPVEAVRVKGLPPINPHKGALAREVPPCGQPPCGPTYVHEDPDQLGYTVDP